MANQSSLIENRMIRVFISSTFRDMQDERDELMKKTFPVLRRKAAERDVTLTELDLRWGITPEESESGKVVEICLREIENSTPFFVGIIGNRYGWIPSPSDLGESLRERFSQVDGYVERHLSVTEMEMQFGVLERPEELHAFFFIKERETDDADEPEKLAALKAAVRSNGRYPVSTYSSPEDLANQVEAAFTQLLDELYPEGALSELEKERIGQRAYLNSLCQNYIRTDSNFAAIEGWMADWERHQLVITGASGLGKSALVANWVKEKLAEGEGLPYRIIYHFVGNGGSLGSHGHVIKALRDEIMDRYGFDADDKEDKTDEKALEKLFNTVAAEGDKPLLIVLDAINQIIDVDNSKQLNWLPIPPRKVKILFTTLEDDRTMEVFKNRHYPVFTLQPLTKGQREEMVRGYLSIFSKKLQPHQIERIVTDSQCENTLVLKTLLDELINFGIFERLDEKIGTYLDTESVEEFYGILLKGYEADFGEPLVKHVLSLIAVSRNGLSEEEILSVTKETPLHWSQFFCAIRQHLIVKNGLVSYAHSYIRKAVEERYLQGKEDWANACRKEIVAYFNGAKTPRAMDEVPFQYDKLGDLESLHGYLMDLDVFEYLKKTEENTLGFYWRKLDESACYSLKDYISLVDRNNDIKRLSAFLALSDFSLQTVVNPNLSLLFLKHIPKTALGVTEDEHMNRIIIKINSSFGLSYSLIGDYPQALLYHKKALSSAILLWGNNDLDVARIYSLLGLTLGDLGLYQEAMTAHKESLQIRVSNLGDCCPDAAESYNNIGYTYGKLNDFSKALEYHKNALNVREQCLGHFHPDTAMSYNNVGFTLNKLNRPSESFPYHETSLAIRRKLYGDIHPSLAMSYGNLGLAYDQLHNYKKALEYRVKSFDICNSLFKDGNLYTAHANQDLAEAYEHLGDYNKAVSFYEETLRIRLTMFGENHPSVLKTYRRIAEALKTMGKAKEANDYNLKAQAVENKLHRDNL